MKRKKIMGLLAVIMLAAALIGILGACTILNGGGSLSVTIDAAGGVLTSKEVYSATVGSEFDLNKLSVPTREGYTFIGWQSGEKIYGKQAVITITESITLTAVWKRDANVVLLTFSDGIGGKPQSVVLNVGDSFDFKKITAPKREGYEFLGWRDGDTVYLAEDENVVSPTEDVEYTAEWKLLTYTVVFKNGANVLTSAEYKYGEIPKIPAFDDVKFPQTTNASATETMVFVGWDKAVKEVTGDVVYTAVYQSRVRIYTLNMESKGVEFADADGKTIETISGAYNSYFEFDIKLKQGVRLDGEKVVRLNGTVLTPNKDGLYSVTLSEDGLSVSVDNLDYVTFDAVFSVTNGYTEVKNNANYGIVYGDSLEFAAWGAAGYQTEIPTVSALVNGTTVYFDPYGQDSDGKYLFRIENITETLTITVYGKQNVYDVTYIDIDGNRLETKYTVSSNTILGDYNAIEDAGWQKVNQNGVTYNAILGVYNSSWQYYRVTTSAELSDRVMTEAQYNEWVAADYPIDPIEPVLYEETVLYLVYYTTTSKYDMSLVVGGYTVEGSFDGGANWEVFGAEEKTFDSVLQPIYPFWATHGTEVRIRLSGGAEGAEYPVFQWGEKTLSPNPSGEYSFVATENCQWVAQMQYHTVTLPALDNPIYKFDDRDLNKYEIQTVSVPHGGDYRFTVIFDGNCSRVLQVGASMGQYITANGKAVEVESFSTQKYFRCVIRNVTEDTVIEIDTTATAATPFTVRIPYSANCDTYFKGEKIVFPEGAKYVERAILLSESCEYTLVPNEGYEFAGTTSSTYPSVSIYYRDKNNKIKTTKIKLRAKKSFAPGAFSYNFSSLSSIYANLVDAGDATATETQRTWALNNVTLRPATVKAEQLTLRSDPTESGAVFTTKPATTTPKIGTYTVSITTPAGVVPTLYLEWSDAKSEGFRPVTAASRSETTYTFEITNPRADFRWYILLEIEEYEVVFDWGVDSMTLKLPHGTPITSVSLPKTFQGVQDGVDGVFTVTHWKHADGTRFLTVNGAETVTAVTTFKTAAASFNGIFYDSVEAALNSLSPTSVGNLDILIGGTGENAETLRSGTEEKPVTYTIPAGVILRLPFKKDGYGYKLAEKEDNPSVLYASQSNAVTGLNVLAGTILRVYGKIEVGATIGYPQSAYPYMGHVSGAYAVLALNGNIVVENGGSVDCYGYIEGSGAIDVKDGGIVNGSFVVRDYRGGTNSSNVYYESVAPFNVYELPNFLVEVTLESGAIETAKANLFALGGYNVMALDVLGGKGLVQHSEGGKIVKTTRRIKNTRYTDATKSYEPEYEYRTRIDVYGGGCDGVLSLDNIVKTTGIPMSINFIYDIHLWSGEYIQRNTYKIMPGGKLTVEAGASLSLEKGTDAMGTLTAYSKTFKDSFGTQNYPQKQLLYPVIEEDAMFVVNGKLSVYGKLGAKVYTNVAGAEIFIYAPLTYLLVEQKEGVAFSGKQFEATWLKTVSASITTAEGDLNLPSGGYYVSYASGNAFLWKAA